MKTKMAAPIPERSSRRGQSSVALLSLLTAAVLAAACTPLYVPVFWQRLERSALGPAWNNTGGSYKIVDGELKVAGARNRPLWLRRVLPDDVRVEFDVKSDHPDGDIKVELFGDGVSKAGSTSYTATSYVVIFGGWHNALNVLARLDEHGADRVVGPAHKVVPGKTYRMKIERRGATIKAWADAHLLGSLTDPQPLGGPGHDHFAFNNWSAPVTFDNLRITPL